MARRTIKLTQGAWSKGWDAAESGKPKSSNPYTDRALRYQWRKGWLAYQRAKK